ncbi:MAG: glycosyltransferase family 2 protein [Oscillospiraceae bacterium]|nr:glycosyltransferase family 2 protein [Oscillospiraceae bacterium]
MRISIIIPVYNGEATLNRCLQSVLNQTFGDYQAVIVDDGSIDGSSAVAAEYAARDDRFQLVTTAHHGTGAARNAGLAQARGEYVLYMDADDYWVCPNLLEQLNRRIDAEPADAFMFQMVKVTEDGHVLTRYTKPRFRQEDTVLALKDIYQDLVRDGQNLASACNKCVRRELLVNREIRFREDIIGEDIDWVLQLFSYVQTICLLNLDAYAYTQHKGESRSSHPDGPNDLVNIVREWGEYAARDGAAHPRAVAGMVAFEYGICMGNYHRLSAEKKRILRQNVRLLQWGLDKKTRMIARFHGAFGFSLTCLAIRVYLLLRRVW